MKHYLELIPITARVRRRQNRMTILCIVIAVFLVTAIFSMADMAVRMEKARMIKEHGNWHISLREPTEQQVEQLAQRPEVAAFTRYDGLNWDLAGDYTVQGKPCVVIGGDPALLTDIYDSLAEGRSPVADNEILLTERAKKLLALELGDVITLHTTAGDFTYTICGFGGDATLSYDVDASVVGALLSWDAFEKLAEAEGQTLEPTCYVQFTGHTSVRRAIAALRETEGFADAVISENTGLLGLTGFSSDSYVVGLYGVAAVLFVLVLAAGVFMIAGSLNSRTAERTQFFGMLRCIGASRKQIMQIVRLEALCWCRTAVPLGVGLGVVGTWLLCALLRFGAGAEFAEIPLFAVSGAGIVSGIVVGVLTVLLSAVSPARRAASVSPVAAVRGNTSQKENPARPLRTSFGHIELTLGVHHAVASRRNLFLMTGSFALSIVLILSFSVLVQWVNMALNPLKPWAPDVFYSSPENQCEIRAEFAAEVAAEPGVKRVFGRMYQSLPAVYGGGEGQIDLISYEEQQFQWAAKDLVAGDLAAVTEGTGVLTVFDKSNTLQVGDSIQLGETTLTVAGVLKDSPFSATDQPTIICSEQLFQQLTGEHGYAVLDVQLTRGAAEEEISGLCALAGDAYRFYDRTAQNRDTKNTYFMFCLFVYGFLGVITLITIIHTVNSISMSVSAHAKQYGVMRAVGMDSAQVKQMIFAEAATYTTLGLLVGCGLGLPMHYLFYTRHITDYWGTAWQLPAASVGGILAVLAAISFLAPFAPAKRICERSVTESISAV